MSAAVSRVMSSTGIFCARVCWHSCWCRILILSSSELGSGSDAKTQSSLGPATPREGARNLHGCSQPTVAIVSALVGSTRYHLQRAPSDSCARFFFFSTTPVGVTHLNWTVVLPAGEDGGKNRTAEHMGGGIPRIVYSKSWRAVLSQITRGRHRALVETGGMHGDERAVALPFDPLSLGHTQGSVLKQNLTSMMAAKFVKCQLLRIDILSRYQFLAWADAGLELGDGIAGRILAGFVGSSELQLLAHPWRRPASVAMEMSQAQEEQARIASLRPYILAQSAAYERAGYPMNRDNSLYWMCFYAVERSRRTADVLDAWWFEIRKWQYRDQFSLPFVLWRKAQEENRPLGIRMLTSFSMNTSQTLCSFLLGSRGGGPHGANLCCRRCKKRHKRRKSKV